MKYTKYFLLLIFMSLNSCSNGTREFKTEKGTIRINIPSNWIEKSESHAIIFGSPNGKATLTVSVSGYEARLIEKVKLENRTFGLPMTEEKPLSIKQGTGYSQEFRSEKKQDDYWLFHFMFFSNSTILASINGATEEINKSKSHLDDILNSIEFTEAEPSASPNRDPGSR